jgi:phosphoribosyl 1,2-cyclic phosphate phosphodiesterase
LKITFLGTGTSQGVPLIGCACEVCISSNPKDNRLRSSVMIRSRDKTLVIDAGPDFRQQMLRYKVHRLDGLLLTHQHKDHIAGLDDIRAYNYHQKSNVDVFASMEVQVALKREFAYIFDGTDYPGIPRINLHAIKEKKFVAGDMEVLPLNVFHYMMPVHGFRVGGFTYVTDANYIPDAEKEKIKGSDVLVLNALRREKHVSHFTLDQAVALINELNPKRAFLTHISHQLGLHDVVNQELPDNIKCAFDGLEIEC